MKLIHRIFQKNTIGRDFVVGDLHGCYDHLMKKLQEVYFDKNKDRLFSVGDLIDRGPNSLDCLELVHEPWFHPVRGNHEQMMFDVILHKENKYLWYHNGGMWYEGLLNQEQVVVADICEYLDPIMPHVITVGDVGIVHAEPHNPWPGGDFHPNLIWGRSLISNGAVMVVDDIDKVYVGHTIVKEPTTMGNIHYIDTGCFHTGNLWLKQI